MIVVTSFSPNGYALYGKRFLESFVELWPCQVVVYYEELPDFKHEKVIYKPLLDVFGIKAFLAYCDRKPIFRGVTPAGYNYNFDASKFCRKSFAQFDALKEHRGKVFWLDADIDFKKPISEEFLNALFLEQTLACLWREGFYSETGFIGFDTEGEKFQDFLSEYESVYRKGLLFTLPQWHDCAALDYAVGKSGVSFNNLSKFYVKNKTQLDVMALSVLGPYMDHLKGARKYGTKKSYKPDRQSGGCNVLDN